MREPTRPPRDHLLGASDQRAHVGHELQLVGEEAAQVMRQRIARGFPRQGFHDAPAELPAHRRVDNALGRNARGALVLDRVIRAVQQVVDRERLVAHERREPAPQCVQRAAELGRDEFVPALVLLDEPLRRLQQKARLLLDQQYARGGRDDHEIDLAEDRVATVDARPVHAVEDCQLVRQPRLEDGERLDLAQRGAGDFEFAPAGGNHLRHGLFVPARARFNLVTPVGRLCLDEEPRRNRLFAVSECSPNG